jgi:hypothetical protein
LGVKLLAQMEAIAEWRAPAASFEHPWSDQSEGLEHFERRLILNRLLRCAFEYWPEGSSDDTHPRITRAQMRYDRSECLRDFAHLML